MKRTNTVADILNSGKATVDVGDGVILNLPLDGIYAGKQGPAGVGVPEGGAPLQLIRKDAAGIGAEWASPDKHLVGLSNVDNTSDAAKPISEPTEAALRGKLGTADAAATYATKASVTTELDQRVPPLVSQAIANDPTVANSAATMAQSNAGLLPLWAASTAYAAGQRVTAPNGDIVTAKAAFTSGAAYDPANWNASEQSATREVYLLESAGSSTDSRAAVNARIPFRVPFGTSKFRVHIRNRNPSTGVVVPGALSFVGVGIGTAQTSGATIYSGLVESVASTITGAFSTPADGAEYVTPWKTDFPLAPGAVYHLTYGYNGPVQANYAGAGLAFTNNSPTGALSKTMASPVTSKTSPLDFWIEAVTDSGSTRRVLYAGITPPASTTVAPIVTSSRTSITAFGDSLTDGGSNGALWPEADTWPYKLDTALTTATVTNLGYSGATVDEMLMRVGALPMRVSVPADGIAASGNAFVTPLQTYGMPAGTRPIDATLNGGAGVRLTKNDDGTWQLYNYGTNPIPAGTAIITPVAAWANRNADTAIIWIGINDITGGVTGMDATVADHVVAGTQKLIEWFTPQVKQFMILGVTTRTNETTGTANHATATEINNRLQALYPGQFKSIQKYLREQAMTDLGITPTQDDLDKIAAGTLPPSVLDVGDIGHISKATATVVANNLIAPWLKAKGYVDG